MTLLHCIAGVVLLMLLTAFALAVRLRQVTKQLSELSKRTDDKFVKFGKYQWKLEQQIYALKTARRHQPSRN